MRDKEKKLTFSYSFFLSSQWSSLRAFLRLLPTLYQVVECLICVCAAVLSNSVVSDFVTHARCLKVLKSSPTVTSWWTCHMSWDLPVIGGSLTFNWNLPDSFTPVIIQTWIVHAWGFWSHWAAESVQVQHLFLALIDSTMIHFATLMQHFMCSRNYISYFSDPPEMCQG